MDDIVVAVRFADVDQARGALHALRQLDEDGRLRVREAALVERSGEGGVSVRQDDEGYFMPPEGIIGMLGDALHGPLGILFARAEGFHGHAAGAAHQHERDLLIEDISRDLEPGVTLVMADIADPDPAVLDSALDGLGGTVTRRAAQDVYAEVQAAEKAADTASEEARRVLREQHGEELKEQWERFKENAKSKLP